MNFDKYVGSAVFGFIVGVSLIGLAGYVLNPVSTAAAVLYALGLFISGFGFGGLVMYWDLHEVNR